MGSVNVEEFPSMRVGSLITSDILNMVRQSLYCVLDMVIQSMFISPTRTTLGHESKAISIEAFIEENKNASDTFNHFDKNNRSELFVILVGFQSRWLRDVGPPNRFNVYKQVDPKYKSLHPHHARICLYKLAIQNLQETRMINLCFDPHEFQENKVCDIRLQ